MVPPIVFIILLIEPIQGYLLDGQLKSPKGSVTIFSSLTDQKTQESWIVRETLAVVPKIHGKIEISRGDEKIQAFYHENNDELKLVMFDNSCFQFKYSQDGWSSMLPSVSTPLLNMALLLGPSFHYRLETGKLLLEDYVQIRGENMRSFAVLLNYDLRISFIFPDSIDDIWLGVESPKRLKLEGWIPGSYSVFESQDVISETLFYDIYSEKEIDDSEGLAIPTLGIGCASYLEQNQLFPGLKDEQFHIQITEIVSNLGHTNFHRNEYYIDTKNQITRIISHDQNILAEFILDHNLGVKYILKNDGSCVINPITSADDLLLVDQITWMQGPYNYVGKTKYEHRSELVDVWESMEFNLTMDGNFYDKVVTTQFMGKLDNSSGNLHYSSDYLPISAEKRFYKIILDKYVLIESRKRDFFDFTTNTFDESEYRQKFQLNDCYDDPYEKMYLTFQITSLDWNFIENIDYASRNINQFRETIKRTISKSLNTSYLRITSIDFEFEEIYILVHVEIVEAPYLIHSLESTQMKFDFDSFNGFDKVSVQGQQECLKVTSSQKDISHVISCTELSNLCVGVKKTQSMPKESESGSYCTIFNNSFDTLKKLVSEATLKDLASNYLTAIGQQFSLDCLDCTIANQYLYLIVNVYQDSPSIDTEAERLLFSDVQNGARLKDGQTIAVQNLGDCYRACSHSDDILCETFSFCTIGDQSECLLSTEAYDESKDLTIVSASCSVYAKNRLLDYQKISSYKFTKPIKSPLTIRSIDECARACSDLDDCNAFQVCDDRYCSFGQHFTSQDLIPINDCDIYIPTRIQNYAKNAHLMIVETIHSEVDLTLEQCAAICYDWTSDSSEDHTDCKSFNYCPKGLANSFCQLTGYSISSDGQQIKMETSDDCSNYELFDESRTQSSTSEQQLNTSTDSGYGVIIFFLVFGLLMGIITPFVHNHVKKRLHKPFQDELSITYEDELSDTTRI